jgi:hypothetical protein
MGSNQPIGLVLKRSVWTNSISRINPKMKLSVAASYSEKGNAVREDSSGHEKQLKSLILAQPERWRRG